MSGVQNLILTEMNFSSVQFCSVAQSCPTLCDPMNRSTPGLPVHHQLPEFTKLTSVESVMPSSHLILCCPLFLLPAVPPSIGISKLIREGWLAVALDLSCIWFACLLYWKYRILAPIPGKSDSIGWYFWLCILQIIGMILMQMARKSTSGNSD